MGRTSVRHLVASGVLVMLGSLAACSGGSNNDSASSAGSADLAAPAPAAGDVGSVPSENGLDSVDKTAPGAARTVVKAKSVIMTGEVTLTSKDLEKVRGEVDDLMKALGGSVDNEQTSNDRKGRVEQSTLVLRVPVDKFDVAKKALMAMGTLKTSDARSKDVTTQVIDIDERVQTLQASLDNLQRYQRSAKDVKDLLDFEEKITARQSELQSLKAQQSYLSDQTSMSTLTLNLSLPDKYVPPPDALEDAGFLSGLEAGWNALGDFVVVGLTVLGALLPFLVAGLVIGMPAWIGLRGLLRRRRSAGPVVPAKN
ncbi:MAG: DUF4349 domain-containing protein [Nocardioidaceae bacterium]